MEITQFTYFQEVGGIKLKVTPGEITYGLERLAMYIQNVDSVYDIKWNKNMSYRDIFHQMRKNNLILILIYLMLTLSKIFLKTQRNKLKC